MVQRGGRADVELVEEDEPPGRAEAARDARAGHAVGQGAARPRRRRPVLAGAVVVAAALVTAQVVSDARERAVLADLRALPGVLAPVPDALEERWRTDGGRLPLPVLGTGSALLGARSTPAGTELVAVDPATGADAWTRRLTAPPAGARDALGTPVPPCAATPAPPDALPDRVACLVSDAWQRDAGLLPKDVPATTSRLVVLRTTDGAVTADHVVDVAPGAPATSLALLGDVAVLGHPVDAGLLVRGVDTVTGAELWRRDAATGAGAVQATDGAVLVPGTDGAELVDAAGAVLRRVPLPADSPAYAVPRHDGTPLAVVDARGPWWLVTRTRDLVLPGPPVAVTVDDERAAPLVLAGSEQRLHAVDATTGDERWSADAPGVHQALVLRGRVHAATDEGVTTYDARTGAVLWTHEHPAAEVPAGLLLTDGADLLVPVADADDGELLRLDRLALADGRTGASVRVPPGLSSLGAMGGALTAWLLDGEGVVALG